MKCYEDPRKTNEETDQCAQSERSVMESLQNELTTRVMKLSHQLEICTDKCIDEKDMTCINQCGTEYMQTTK